MSEKVTLDRETVERLIDGASHLYVPAFPDDDERDTIREAVQTAETAIEGQCQESDTFVDDDTIVPLVTPRNEGSFFHDRFEHAEDVELLVDDGEETVPVFVEGFDIDMDTDENVSRAFDTIKEYTFSTSFEIEDEERLEELRELFGDD